MVSPAFLSPPPPPPPAPPKSTLPMLYYGLIVVGTASIVLALYNLIVLRWCSDRRIRQESRNLERIGGGGGAELPASFRYKREMETEDWQGECAVCLSAFEEGEEIRRLPRCRHAFHAHCIDMWLFSHADCPLCRSPVAAAAGGEVFIVNA